MTSCLDRVGLTGGGYVPKHALGGGGMSPQIIVRVRTLKTDN